MTTVEACELCVAQTRRLAVARRDAEVWRDLSLQLAFRMSDLARQLAEERRRRYALLEERRGEQVTTSCDLPDGKAA